MWKDPGRMARAEAAGRSLAGGGATDTWRVRGATGRCQGNDLQGRAATPWRCPQPGPSPLPGSPNHPAASHGFLARLHRQGWGPHPASTTGGSRKGRVPRGCHAPAGSCELRSRGLRLSWARGSDREGIEASRRTGDSDGPHPRPGSPQADQLSVNWRSRASMSVCEISFEVIGGRLLNLRYSSMLESST